MQLLKDSVTASVALETQKTTSANALTSPVSATAVEFLKRSAEQVLSLSLSISFSLSVSLLISLLHQVQIQLTTSKDQEKDLIFAIMKVHFSCYNVTLTITLPLLFLFLSDSFRKQQTWHWLTIPT